MYYDYDDYVADNYEMIMAEDAHIQELKDELAYFEELLAKGDTTHFTLDKIKTSIKDLKEMLGE